MKDSRGLGIGHVPYGHLFLLLFPLLWAFSPAAVVAAQRQRPNILLITSEDNGPDLGCYGDPYAQTPHLDRLAAEGIRFERAFVTTASCSESRASILTGLYPHQNGQIGLATHHYRMFEGVSNVVGRLKRHGYRTGLVGKLHVNPESEFPFDFRPDVMEFNTFSQRDVGRVAAAARELFTAGERPFFLMVNYADAHLPFLRRQHGLPRVPLEADDVRPLPWIGMDTPELRQSQADYYNCLSRMDTGVGMLLVALEEAGAADDTLILYLGDHGAQFPRGKRASYESSLRIPLIVRWPGKVAAGLTRSELVSTIDLVPTILNVVAANVPDNLPGRSLLPLFDGKDSPWRRYLYSEYHCHNPPLYFPQRTVRDEHYKLIINLLQDRSNPVAEDCTSLGETSYVAWSDVESASESVRAAYATWLDAPPIELYDLKTDPHEWQNLADDPKMAGVRARLLQQLHRWQDQTDDPLREPHLLRQLTAEHDGLGTPYRRPKQPHWNYPNYLHPNRDRE